MCAPRARHALLRPVDVYFDTLELGRHMPNAAAADVFSRYPMGQAQERIYVSKGFLALRASPVNKEV
jgi:hypothetical protein